MQPTPALQGSPEEGNASRCACRLCAAGSEASTAVLQVHLSPDINRCSGHQVNQSSHQGYATMGEPDGSRHQHECRM